MNGLFKLVANTSDMLEELVRIRLALEDEDGRGDEEED
jgi:hypothetical protein